MKLSKMIIGATGVVGAIVLAPVVVPAAAAAGTAAIAAVGTAATAATTAVASSAVGTAAIGAMTAVGSTVGTAAGAVGLGSVATVAGTSAGAAAVGTIATSGAIGAASAASGAKKIKDASDIKKTAEEIYDNERKVFDEQEKKTNAKLEKLGKTKLKAWDLLKTFVDNVEKIKNIDFEGELALDEELKLDVNELKDIKVLAITIKDALKGGTMALTGGQLVGLATSTGFTSIATASTGTAIASLHGAAATNASLAALGGGSLASGGLGMAGGAVVANALAFAPAMAIGGLFINSKGKKNINVANELMGEAVKLKEDMENAVEELGKLEKLAERMNTVITTYSDIFGEYNLWLSQKVREEDDFRKYKTDEQKKFKIAFKVAVILKNLTITELMNDDNEVQVDSVNKVIEDSHDIYESAVA